VKNLYNEWSLLFHSLINFSQNRSIMIDVFMLRNQY
jgi:hypothetical protein